MRKVTIAVVLALLTLAVLAAGCPRHPDTTNVSVDQQTPPPVTTTADSTKPGGDTKVDVDVNQTDPNAPQTEGDKTTGDATKDGDANGGDKTGDANGNGDAGKTGDTPPAEPAKGDANVTTVMLETSKGNITLAVHKDWSPLGAAHFIELVNAKYYDGAPWFRVMPGFMCQTGIAADPEVTKKWKDATIQDEPVVQGNKAGYVAFGQSGAPNSRSTHFFINYVDNSAGLDGQGFACFAQVTAGMDIAEKFKPTGDGTVDQGQLTDKGISYFKGIFPDGDTITRAYVKEDK